MNKKRIVSMLVVFAMICSLNVTGFNKALASNGFKVAAARISHAADYDDIRVGDTVYAEIKHEDTDSEFISPSGMQCSWFIKDDAGETQIDGENGALLEVPESALGKQLIVKIEGNESTSATSEAVGPVTMSNETRLEKEMEAIHALIPEQDDPKKVFVETVVKLHNQSENGVAIEWSAMKNEEAMDVDPDSLNLSLPASGIDKVELVANLRAGEAVEEAKFQFDVFSAQAKKEWDEVEKINNKKVILPTHIWADGGIKDKKLKETILKMLKKAGLVNPRLEAMDIEVYETEKGEKAPAVDDNESLIYLKLPLHKNKVNKKTVNSKASVARYYVVCREKEPEDDYADEGIYSWIEINTALMTGWDINFLKKEIENKVFSKINEKTVRGNNSSLKNISKPVYLPIYIKNPKGGVYKEGSIVWKSSNSKLAKIVKVRTKKYGLCYKLIPSKKLMSSTVKLTATYKFNHFLNSQESREIAKMKKTFTIGNFKKKTVVLKMVLRDGQGRKPRLSKKYKLSSMKFKSTNKKVITVSKNGFVKTKGAGFAWMYAYAPKTTIKIKCYVLPGNMKKFYVKKRGATLTFHMLKARGATGNILYRGVSFGKGKPKMKTFKVFKNTKEFSVKLNNPRAKYYFFMRSYKKVGKKTLYGKASPKIWYKR